MFRYFFWTTLFLILSAGVFLFTVTQLDPLGSQNVLAIVLFFVSLIGSICTVLTYIFFFAAELGTGMNLSERYFRRALRRGFFIAFFIAILGGLRLFNLLGWTEALLLGIFIGLVELIFSMDSAKIPAK